MDLRSNPLSQSLGNPTMKPATLLRVREVLDSENFEFSVLLDESKDGESIVVERRAFDGTAQSRRLHRVYTLFSGTTLLFCTEGDVHA